MPRRFFRPIRCFTALLVAFTAACVPSSFRLLADSGQLDGTQKIESSEHFTGSALATVVVQGERRRVRLQISWGGDSSFSCTVFDPFGGTIARLWSDSSGGAMDVGQSQIRLEFDRPLDDMSFLPRNRFTFAQLIRILSGRTPTEVDLDRSIDSIAAGRRTLSFIWNSDSGRTCVELGRDGEVNRVVVNGPSGPNEVWYAEYGGYIDGVPRWIRVGSGAKEYFSMKYERIIFLDKKS